MKSLPIVIAALAFCLPIGFVLMSGSESGSAEPTNGKLLYFYAPS